MARMIFKFKLSSISKILLTHLILLIPLRPVLSQSGDSPLTLSNVSSWVYQLQDIDLTAIRNTTFDLVIIDYSNDGTEQGEFTPAQINALKHSPAGDKIVLSYMSIGEAEDYRFYWNDSWTPGNPAWLDQENPDWEGNYKVRYWQSEWQNIILQYTDRLLDADFDGAYLDIIDAYEYYDERGRASAAQDMVDFVATIAAHVRTRNPDFLIIPQNAPELASEVPDYLNHVNGIAQEDTYYGYDSDGILTPDQATEEMEAYLNVFKNNEKIVLTVDYPFGQSEDIPHFDAPTQAKIDDAYGRSSANGYIPYCTVRNLNFLTINPGHEPTGIQGRMYHKHPRTMLLLSYPNPFNSETTIEFTFPSDDFVDLSIHDMKGRKIKSLICENHTAGKYQIHWDGKTDTGVEAASGMYICLLKANNIRKEVKLLLLR
jgi:cysteinyl-tRNA synthetase